MNLLNSKFCFVLIASVVLPLLSFTQVSLEWSTPYNGQGTNGEDEAISIVVDDDGNMYVTGKSQSIAGNDQYNDYATIKYDPNGNVEWTKRYNGPGNNIDEPSSLFVDGSGNVYVTGSSAGAGTFRDFATIKYSASGEEEWVQRYNGPMNSNDYASAVKVDGSGNVYVTGRTPTADGNMMVTIQYNSAGTQQWIRLHEDDASSASYSMAIDNSGNVLVTGSIGGDYGTIKYNSAGTEQWVAIYNGPGNANDDATSVLVDGSGNVYVTGASQGIASEVDYATIKYNSAGVEQWVQRYDGPANSGDQADGIALDGAGNVYVTGHSFGNESEIDYATIKYNSSGVEQWTARYDGQGPGQPWDFAKSIAVDNSGNVYVTGRSKSVEGTQDYATLKYNSDGMEQWVVRYNGPGNSFDVANSIKVDDTGNVFVTGASFGNGTETDYATIKYDASGVQQIARRYNGPPINNQDQAKAIAADDAGNVYVTGQSVGAGTSWDYVTIKYNSIGVSQWESSFSASANNVDSATDIAVDASGNVYVTGESLTNNSSWNFITIKYSSDGETLWIKSYEGGISNEDRNPSLAIDELGNVYVTGQSLGNGTSWDYATIKYDSNGEELWVSRYNSAINNQDIPTDIGVDSQGNVYVTGKSVGNAWDYLTVKYDSEGEYQWEERYNHANDNDEPVALAIDGMDNVIVTGSSVGAGAWDYATIKYAPNGGTEWTQRYNGPPSNNQDFALAMAIDGSDNVYVSGASISNDTGYDYATVKYEPENGDQQWVSRYDGAFNEDWATALVIDVLGDIYVTGRSVGSGTSWDYATIKYEPEDGDELWVERYNRTPPGNDQDQANALAVDASGNVYVTGQSVGSGTSWDFVTIRYSQPFNVSVETLDNATVLNAYPNPSTGNCTIVLDRSYPKIGVRILNYLGMELQRREYSNSTQIEMAIDHPAGIYFIEVITDKRSTIKVIKN